MKIACLIGNPPMLSNFIHALHKAHALNLVIREEPPLRLQGRIAELGLGGTIQAAGRKLQASRTYAHDAQKVFGAQPEDFPKERLLTTADINSESVTEALAELKPDLVLVNGTSIIRSSTLAGVSLVLNIHAGLSPYYRGSFCSEWALLNHDPYNIGYTIHRLSGSIDGGDILSQGRAAISTDDTARSIHMKLIRDSTAELSRIIHQIARGTQPSFHAQEGPGFLYLAKHWTAAHRKALAALIKEDGIARMLEKPARRALPVIQWKDAG